jgi:hypothetical protein
MLSIKTLNPNFAGATLVLLIVLALTKRLGNLPWFFLGALYGLLGATRNLALFFLPAILYRTLYSSKPLKNLAFFISGAFIMVIPILFWNNYAFGNVFAHPTQYPWFEGYRPVFEHNFLGLRFEFNGLLNFPFFEKIIRTPHYPFPVFIYLPLLFVHVFGIILICLIPLGCYSLYKNQKKNAVFLAMFFFPYLFFLLFQENWEVAKTTFIILAMPGILFFMAQGISELFKMKAIRRNSIIFLFSFVVIVLAQHLASLSDFPADARWYKRFPKALNISEEKFDLYGGFDKEWKFFQFKENRVITAKQKEDLTSLNLLPDISINLFPDNEISKIENEFESKNIRIFNIWNTIYITTT